MDFDTSGRCFYWNNYFRNSRLGKFRFFTVFTVSFLVLLTYYVQIIVHTVCIISFQPLRVDKVKVHTLKDPGTFLLVYLNEYRILVSAYVLQASTGVIQAKWTEMIDKAKVLKGERGVNNDAV